MSNFTSKINAIRDLTVTMQPPAAVSHQLVHYRYPEEQFHSFATIGEEELYKLVKSAKPTTCMLDPIPSKLLKEVLPELIDPLLAIINSSLSLWYVVRAMHRATHIFYRLSLHWSIKASTLVWQVIFICHFTESVHGLGYLA